MANQEPVYPLPSPYHRYPFKVIKTAKPAVLCPNGRASSLRVSSGNHAPHQQPASNFNNESPKGGIYAVSNPSIVHTSDATFDKDVLKSDKPVLLDFWAEWCGPCKMIAPILDEIADTYKDKIRIAKLNIDDNPHTPPKFNIRGIPTLILFKNGTVEAQKVGAVTKSQLAAFLDSNL
jgi:thioredoxin 1